MASHVQMPTQQGKENAYKEGKGVCRGYSKQSAWLVIGWVLARKEEQSLFFLLVLLLSKGMRAPPSGLLTLFNWGFCLSHFYKANIFLPFLMYAFLTSLSKFDLGRVLSMNSTSFTWLLKQCKTFKSFRYIDTVTKTALYWSLSLYFRIIFLRQLYRDS